MKFSTWIVVNQRKPRVNMRMQKMKRVGWVMMLTHTTMNMNVDFSDYDNRISDCEDGDLPRQEHRFPCIQPIHWYV